MLHARGTLLSIYLDDRSTATESIDDVLESFVGGRGVGTKLAHDRIPFDVDPLSGANRLVFTTGPMQQSNMSFTGRMNCTGVSPLTGGLLSSNAGGYMSRPFSDTGHAAIEITGASDDLVAVHVTDEGVEFEDVSDLAGADVPETVEYVEETRDLDASHVAAIGPAGENEVRFAAIMTSESRAFGRGGLGAVFGAKNLKAITFDGDSAPEIDIPDVTGEIHREAATSDSIMKRQGTTATVDLANEVDALPTYYFADQSFEGAEGINGDAVEAKKYRKGTCSQCAFACKLPTRDEESGLETEGPEYETTMSFGSNAGVDDIVAVMKSNDLCDEYGLDTISAGDVVSAYLASEDEFGNVALIHDLVEKIAHREGVGDTLAEGIDRIHDDLGVENWSVKGLEFPAHDGRALNGMGLGFATSNRGADHLYSTFYEREYPLVGEEKAFPPEGLDGKPAALVEKENTNAVLDSGVICRFSRDFVDEERLSTLFDTDWSHLLDVGGRIVDLERHFNNRRGFDREDDRLPYDRPGFEAALEEYYENRGWMSGGTVPDEQVS